MDEWPEDRNIYGCKPCPACGSKYRTPGTVGDVARGVKEQECNDCGHREPWDEWLNSYLEDER